MEEPIDVLSKLENTGYDLSESKSDLFKTEKERIGHKVDQNGFRSLQEIAGGKMTKRSEQ